MGNKNTDFDVYFLELFCFLILYYNGLQHKVWYFLKVNNVKNKVKSFSFTMLYILQWSDNSLFDTDA